VNCVVCSSNDWRSLPVPSPGQSVTTSGIIIAEPLEREQCMACGLLQRKDRRFVGHKPFYEEHYQNYYERPSIERFDRGRYVAMAEWMKSVLGDDFTPRSILDVGCGAGWSMEATRRIYTTASIAGIEPSIANAKKARSAGFEVHSTRFGNGASLSEPYDLIYSNNVLQHVTNLPGYFRDLAANLAAGGFVALILPDATDASNEMLWCDHNYSFRPKDLVALAEPTGLCVHNWQSNPPDNALLHKQIVVLTRADASRVQADVAGNLLPSDALFEQRASYMSNWQKLDGELTRRTAGRKRVFNFGASMWTWLLAAYCPNYWDSVSACLVDAGSGRCMDKPVASPADIEFSEGDCIALGVNPANQAGFEKKLRGLAINIVGWADLISG